MVMNWCLPSRIFHVNGKKPRKTVEVMMWGTISVNPFSVTAKFLKGIRLVSFLPKMTLFKCDIV